MPFQQDVNVFPGSTPFNVSTFGFRVDGATFAPNASVTVSDPTYSFTATPTGGTVNDPNGDPRPVIDLVCTGFSSGVTTPFNVNYNGTGCPQLVSYIAVDPAPAAAT